MQRTTIFPFSAAERGDREAAGPGSPNVAGYRSLAAGLPSLPALPADCPVSRRSPDPFPLESGFKTVE